MQKTLVVDANIARSAGNSDAAESACSREALACIRERTDHVLGFNELLWGEWDEHESMYSSSWRTAMVQADRIDALSSSHLDWENLIELTDVNFRAAIMKDVHLLDGALVSDKIVISNERRCRRGFCTILHQVTVAGEVMWAGPCEPSEATLTWLERGAPYDPARRLCITAARLGIRGLG